MENLAITLGYFRIAFEESQTRREGKIIIAAEKDFGLLLQDLFLGVGLICDVDEILDVGWIYFFILR